MAEHVELQRSDRGKHRRRLGVVEVAQHLHDALLVELFDPLAELLGPPRVERAGGGEDLGGEAWDLRVAHGRPRLVHGVPELQPRGIHEADDVAREGDLDGLPLGTERSHRVFRGQLASGPCTRHGHPPVEAPGADPRKCQAITV